MLSTTITVLILLKIILISIGAISIAMAIKFSVLSIMAFTCYDLPIAWKRLRAWLRPRYLYFIVNCIIIAIAAAASSRYSHHQQGNTSSVTSVKPPPPSSEVVPAPVGLAEYEAELNRNVVEPVAVAEREADLNMNVVEALPPPPPSPPSPAAAAAVDESNVVELKPVVVNGVQIDEADEDDDVATDDWMSSDSTSTLPQEIVSLSNETELDSLLPVKENQKPLVSSRFGYRQPIKTGPEDDDGMSSGSISTLPQEIVSLSTETEPDSLSPVKENQKPLISPRFSYRKPVKTGPEGGRRTLRAARTNKHETMENTGKMITEGSHVPPTRQFKKSDTGENHGREVVVNSLGHEFPTHSVLKSETFRDRTKYDVPTVPPGRFPRKILREPSMRSGRVEPSMGHAIFY